VVVGGVKAAGRLEMTGGRADDETRGGVDVTEMAVGTAD